MINILTRSNKHPIRGYVDIVSNNCTGKMNIVIHANPEVMIIAKVKWQLYSILSENAIMTCICCSKTQVNSIINHLIADYRMNVSLDTDILIDDDYYYMMATVINNYIYRESKCNDNENEYSEKNMPESCLTFKHNLNLYTSLQYYHDSDEYLNWIQTELRKWKPLPETMEDYIAEKGESPEQEKIRLEKEGIILLIGSEQ